MDVLCSLRQLGKQIQDVIQELLRITVLARLPIPVLHNNLSCNLFDVRAKSSSIFKKLDVAKLVGKPFSSEDVQNHTCGTDVL